MTDASSHVSRFARTGLVAVTSVFVAVFISACAQWTGRVAEPPPPPPATDSLLFHTPYVGDETSLRDQAPQPERMVLDEVSIAGWRLPVEVMLRFPVEIREGARFAFSIGAATRVPIRIGDIAFRVEYAPEGARRVEAARTNSPDPPLDRPDLSEASEGAFILFQTTPVDTPQIFSEWYPVDVPLDAFAPGKGEIRFSSVGRLSGDPGLDIILGRPAIYYPEERRHKNVLLIGVDTLRRDALTCYGAPEDHTPNLEEFSQSSTVFDQARSQAPWTLPSFSSMVSGALPSGIGATIYTGHLPDRNLTVGEVLMEAGYATGTFCSNTWLGNDESGFHQGMEELWFRYDANAGASVDKAREFITRSIARDWFCFLHFIDPHAPYHPPQEYIERMCDPGYSGPYVEGFGAVEIWKSGEVVPDPDDLQHIRNLYNGEVAYLDSALGSLFDFLEENGLIDETLIVFSSDHGEEFFEHGGFEHGHTQYDELVHMPLIVRGPGFPAGERIATNVGNTDIAPTILDYVGLEIPDSMIGAPLQDVVAGDANTARIVFGEDNSRGTLRKFCVQWPYKCILDFVTGERGLYDLEKDPGETADVSEAHTELTRDLSDAIIAAMIPEQTAFHIWITRSYGETPKVFSGTFRVPGGIERVYDFKLSGDDHYAVQGDTVSFSIASSYETLGPNKHLLIVPAEGADVLEATVYVDGQIQPDRFFPYGSRTPEPSGSATVRIDDFALGPNLPLAIEEYPSGLYVWAVRGYGREEGKGELDEQTREQLRALGYLNE